MYGRLMGLNRKQVDEYLENLNKTSQERIEFAKERIKQELEENSKLQLLLDKLKAEKETYLSQEKYIEASKKRLKDTLLALDKFTNEEIEKNIGSVKEKLSSYDKRLEDAKNEIRATRSNIDELFHKIKGVLQEDKKPEEEFNYDEDSRNNIKLVPFSKEKIKVEEVVKEEPESKIEANQIEAINEQQHEETQEEASFIRKSDSQKITADGLSIKDLERLSSSLVSHPSRTNKKIDVPDKIIAKKEFDGFWGDSDNSYIPNDSSAKVNTPTNNLTGNFDMGNKIIPEFVPSIEVMPKNDFVPEVPQDKPTNIPLFVKTESVSATPHLPTSTPRPDTSAGSPAVAKEIELIRHRYIVGKLSGEDMYDSEGRLIISKNTVITPEIIVKAETEGKLPDLIVNMILPGI